MPGVGRQGRPMSLAALAAQLGRQANERAGTILPGSGEGLDCCYSPPLPISQRREQNERGQVTCPRSHSEQSDSWDGNLAVCLRTPIPFHHFLLAPLDTVSRTGDGGKTWKAASNLDLRGRKCFSEEVMSQLRPSCYQGRGGAGLKRCSRQRE